ncbi:MAG: phospholipase D-like domain-containing protein, partial [Candidatus Thorarchaeota archaeon]
MKRNRYKLASLLIITALLSGYLSLLAPNQMEPYTVDEPDEFSIAETYDWTVFEKDMNVTTFVAPDGSYEELQHILNEAEESLYVEIYGINNPEILDWLNIMHDSNPSMDIKVLIGWNSLGYTSVNRFVANNLTQEGIEVKWTGAGNFTYAHQKYFVIDNKTAVIHAGNWAKTSFAPYNYRTNREWSIAMTDVDVASYYLSVFDGDWFNGTVYDPIEHGTGTALTTYSTTSTYQRPFSDPGHFSGNMKVIPIFSPDTSLQGILYCINSAKYTLDIQIPYFTSVGDGGAVDQVIDAILDAKTRGVTVRVITDEEKDYVEIAHMLTEVDIPVVWHDTRWFSANHNK